MPIIIEKYPQDEIENKDQTISLVDFFHQNMGSWKRNDLLRHQLELMRLFDSFAKETIVVRLEKDLAITLEQQYHFVLDTMHQYELKQETTFILKYPEKEGLPIPSYLFENIEKLLQKSQPAYHMLYERASPYEAVEEMLHKRGKTFTQMLFHLIDKKGQEDVEVYRKANIDRRLFSKIKSNQNYHPSKATVVAFAISLELNQDETEDLLGSAGYSLSDSYPFDIIIRYFIQNENYHIDEINAVLVEFGQKGLGVIE